MRIAFGGHDFILHPSGALFWPARRMLVVADLHLEKGSHYARRGYFLPPYDSREILQRLLFVASETQALSILVLGDGFHDAQGFNRMGEQEVSLFSRLRDFGLVWIKGNHDADFLPFGLPAHNFHEEGGILFRHEAGSGGHYEISGHFHPKIEIAHKGGFVSCRCFIEDGRRLVLPAFGAYTGGLAINSPALSRLFPDGQRCYAINNEKLYLIGIQPGMRA